MRYRRWVSRCDNGRIRGWEGEHRRPQLRFHRCNTCDVVTLPYVLRWLDWRWIAFEIRYWFKDLGYRRTQRKQDREYYRHYDEQS